MIYAMALTGLEFWRYLFAVKKGDTCDPIDQFLDLNNDDLAIAIKDFEKENQDIKMSECRILKQFIEEKYNNNPDHIALYQIDDGWFLTPKFHTEYNKWAQSRQLTTYKYSRDMAEVIDLASSEEIEVKNHYILGDTIYGFKFPVSEIFEAPIEKPKEKPKSGQVDMERVLDGTSKYRAVLKDLVVKKLQELNADVKPVEVLDIYEPLSSLENFTEEKTKELLNALIKDGIVFNPRPDLYRLRMNV